MLVDPCINIYYRVLISSKGVSVYLKEKQVKVKIDTFLFLTPLLPRFVCFYFGENRTNRRWEIFYVKPQ